MEKCTRHIWTTNRNKWRIKNQCVFFTPLIHQTLCIKYPRYPCGFTVQQAIVCLCIYLGGCLVSLRVERRSGLNVTASQRVQPCRFSFNTWLTRYIWESWANTETNEQHQQWVTNMNILHTIVSDTHPAEAGDGEGNARLKLVWILLAQAGDEGDGCCHYTLTPPTKRKWVTAPIHHSGDNWYITTCFSGSLKNRQMQAENLIMWKQSAGLWSVTGFIQSLFSLFYS